MTLDIFVFQKFKFSYFSQYTMQLLGPKFAKILNMKGSQYASVKCHSEYEGLM